MHSDKMKNQSQKSAEGSLSSSDFLEGESDAAKQLYNYVKLVSPTNMSVLINGASGTGKEYVAHRIHQLSKRGYHRYQSRIKEHPANKMPGPALAGPDLFINQYN